MSRGIFITHSDEPCRGCGHSEEDDARIQVLERFDAYGITTGYWCHECYDSSRYPYRKDKYYDYLEAGEYLDDNY